MRKSLLIAPAAALLLALVPLVPSGAVAATDSDGTGLWATGFQATVTDCGWGSADANNFCSYDDPGSVELGVRFRSTIPLAVTGVRVYRVDAGAMTGSLWSDSGQRIATGRFAAFAGTGWQNLLFDTAVPIAANTTYVASYYAPDATYAYQYGFFTASGLTVGPVTALQSVAGHGGGTYCYDDPTCFPDATFRDSSYWVTPLWRPLYNFVGFKQPVDNGIWNQAKAGSAIPVKFSLGGDRGLNVLQAGGPTATAIACPSASTFVDPIETSVAASTSGLTYDASSDQYTYVWKTAKTVAGQCLRFSLQLNDLTSHTFDVQFTR